LPSTLPARDFLALAGFTRHEIEPLIDTAIDFGDAFTRRSLRQVLAGRSLALWFPEDGFWNRCAFELGVQLLGGRTVHVPGEPGVREPQLMSGRI
jgi:ornithine carbamoyltransferase